GHEFKSEVRAPLIPELRHALLESQPNRRCPRLGTERTDTEHLRRLLRARRKRPGSRAAEQRDELAASHWITSQPDCRVSISGLTVAGLGFAFGFWDSYDPKAARLM